MRDYILKQEKVYDTFQTEGTKSRTTGVSCGCDSAPCWLCLHRNALISLCLCSLIWKMDRIVVPTSGLLKWHVERAWSPFA